MEVACDHHTVATVVTRPRDDEDLRLTQVDLRRVMKLVEHRDHTATSAFHQDATWDSQPRNRVFVECTHLGGGRQRHHEGSPFRSAMTTALAMSPWWVNETCSLAIPSRSAACRAAP